MTPSATKLSQARRNPWSRPCVTSVAPTRTLPHVSILARPDGAEESANSRDQEEPIILDRLTRWTRRYQHAVALSPVSVELPVWRQSFIVEKVGRRASIVSVSVESWADVLSLLAAELTAEDRAGGWTEERRAKYLLLLQTSIVEGSRFLPAHASQLVKLLAADGITSGPVAEAIARAKSGIPGVGTPKAVAQAVREVATELRKLGFKGRTPNLARELDEGTLHLVSLQRINAGVTGREPSFTVNLNVVPGALRRAWAGAQHWKASQPVRSSGDTGIGTRLGQIALGRDHWWRPSDEREAHEDAIEVVRMMHSHGLPWLDLMTTPDIAIAESLGHGSVLWPLETAAALLSEHPDRARRHEVALALRPWSLRVEGDDKRLVDWLIGALSADQLAT